MQLALGLPHRRLELVALVGQRSRLLAPRRELARRAVDLSRHPRPLLLEAAQALGQHVALAASASAGGAPRLALLARLLDVGLRLVEPLLALLVDRLGRGEIGRQLALRRRLPGQLAADLLLLGTQRLLGERQAAMALRRLLAPGRRDRRFLFEMADLVAQCVDRLRGARARGDDLAQLVLHAVQLGIEQRYLLGELGALALAGEEARLRLLAGEPHQTALGPQPFLRQEGDAGVAARQALGVGRGGDEVGRRQGAAELVRQPERLGERGDDRRIVAARPGEGRIVDADQEAGGAAAAGGEALGGGKGRGLGGQHHRLRNFT